MILHIALVEASVKKQANKENGYAALPGWRSSPSPAGNVTDSRHRGATTRPLRQRRKRSKKSYLWILRYRDMHTHTARKSDQTAEIVAWLVTVVK
jgi:hypothetical protein